jgi:hypothetical protein
MKKTLLLSTLLLTLNIQSTIAQCDNFYSIAVPSGDTLHCTGGDMYRTAVAFNPVKQLYYSVNAGGSAYDEVFNINGQKVGSSIAVDWRGLWWNPNQNVIEGNTWDNYFAVDSLQSNGHLGGTIYTFPGNTTPPNVQSAGTYDPSQNLIYYYYNGTLYGESRTGLVDITPITLTGLASFTDVISHSLFYYDCPGKEIVLFENGSLNKRLLFFNKSTGAFSAAVLLPSSLGSITYTGGSFSFANDIVWLYNFSINKWVGYDFIQSSVGINELKQNIVSIYPNPTNSTLNIEVKEQTQISILNILSEVVKTETINGTSKLDVSNLNAGVYFIQDAKSGKAIKFIKE